jgi:CRISPR-associated endonuclease/helicase Cas3
MNILLVSQCSKNALTRTRQILDQFAERRGDRVWQTAITWQGMETLHRLLRQTARRNTAVACHWIRGKDHSELLWVVGDARQFNERGAVPTNTTERDVLRAGDENDWHSGEDIRLLAKLAALFHDIGKANTAFQKKLTATGKPVADAYRHEWVSLRLFEAFVRHCGDTDQAWLANLADLPKDISASCLAKLQKDSNGQMLPPPFKNLPPLARLVGWLIVSHHRMPTPQSDNQRKSALEKLPESVEHDWCGSCPEQANAKACFEFKQGLAFDSQHWREHAAKVAGAILQRPRLTGAADQLLDDPYLSHLSRMALMLADHYYSAQPSHARYGDPVSEKKAVYANTDREGNLKRRLDEHLIGVEVNASRIVRSLPRLADTLPRIARHKAFRERSKAPFHWQNQAYECAASLQPKADAQGFFGINMASTGCGKTLANGRIMYALANSKRGARFTVALGLRTLTLQTGDAYRERLHLGAEDLAVLVGGVAVRDLHNYQVQQAKAQAEESQAARQGTESSAELLPAHNYVHYEGSLEDGPLKEWMGKSDALRLLDAPVLVCTIDHLMPATEGTRGGHQIPPMLRLLTSDLVLDEPDDFGMEDLPALTRLVHWAGLLGSRVLLSSATLPPALVQGLFQAYCAGRESYQANRGILGLPFNVCCAWFDEFGATASDHAKSDDYLAAHLRFVERRLAKLEAANRQQIRRRALIQPLPIQPKQPREILCRELAPHLRSFAYTLHRQHHSEDPKTGQRVSFGLIRMANIDPLFDVALNLFALGAETGCQIHICVYHSRHPLLIRAAIERELDAVLKRHDPEAVFQYRNIRERLDATAGQDHLFIVLATAVAEVGRDHDYDWAIVEPSSMRSIIQLAGRVRRHRLYDCPQDKPNIHLLDTNLLHLQHGDGQPAFIRPGFETAKNYLLQSHRLTELLTPEQTQIITAAPRIQARTPLTPQTNLADLEHARLADLMLGADKQDEIPATLWYQTRASLTGHLQRKRPFRYDPQGRKTYALLPDDDGGLQFYELADKDRKSDQSGRLHTLQDLAFGPGITRWAVPDYLEELERFAEAKQMELADCAQKYAIIDLPEAQDTDQHWRYHGALGFSRMLDV